MSTTRTIEPETPANGGEVVVNGTARAIPSSCTVDRLLELLGLAEQRVAVAVNREVVPRSTYGVAQVRDGDQIEVLEAVGGG